MAKKNSKLTDIAGNMKPFTQGRPEDGGSIVADHGRLLGLEDDDHQQYLNITGKSQTVEGDKTFRVPPSIINEPTGDNQAIKKKNLDDHKESEDHSGYAHDWQAVQRFFDNIFTQTILPLLPDTYDVGSDTSRFRSGFFSELSSLIFRKENVVILDGQFLVTKMAGKLESAVNTVQSTVNFGRTMIPGDFVLFRSEGKMEYMRILSKAALGEWMYNVSRNLDGSGANDWSEGEPFAVLGKEGEGWLEMSAVDESRLRFSVWVQGSAYNNSLEIIRMGKLDGWQNAGLTGFGLVIGNFASGKYLTYTNTGGLTMKGGVFEADSLMINNYGIRFTNPGSTQYDPIRFVDDQGNTYFRINGGSKLGRTEGKLQIESQVAEGDAYCRLNVAAIYQSNTPGQNVWAELNLYASGEYGSYIESNVPFVLPAFDPTGVNHAARKAYVDSRPGRYVPLITPAKVLDGIARNVGNYTVNLNAYGIPTTASGLVIRVSAQWAGSSSGSLLAIRATEGGDALLVVRASTNLIQDNNGVVPISGGRFVYSIVGANAATVYIYITGYYT